MGGGVHRFTNLRAWQACIAYKKAIYRLCEQPPLDTDWKRRCQLEESVRGTGAHLAEGYERFNPPDFARFVVMARASLMESQNHRLDLVDRGYISDDRRVEFNALAEAALEQVTGLLEYLQSPDALRNARRARERRIATWPDRRPPNSEP
jgi:four helix bundle protein